MKFVESKKYCKSSEFFVQLIADEKLERGSKSSVGGKCSVCLCAKVKRASAQLEGSCRDDEVAIFDNGCSKPPKGLQRRLAHENKNTLP